MKEILYAILVLGALGAVFGALLAIASRVFAVKVDERLPKLTAALPGANCGGCGFAGCGAYAQAVLEGKAPVGLCAAGGAEAAKKMSEVMGITPVEVEKMVAMVKCRGKNHLRKGQYDGIADCRAASFVTGNGPTATFDFDLDLAVQQSSENPVYYVQYAHARICSVLKLVMAEGLTEEDIKNADLALLVTPEERELCRRLGQLPDEIVAAAKYYDPARMTRYAMEVAALYHKFYQNCRVKCEDSAVCAARAALCRATATVLENTLGMLKITAPEVM